MHSLLITLGILCRHRHMLTLFQGNGYIVTSSMLMDLWPNIRLIGLCVVSPNNTGWIMMKPLVLWSSLPPFAWYYHFLSLVIGLFINWMSKMPSCMVLSMRLFIANNLLGLLIRLAQNMCASSTRLAGFVNSWVSFTVLSHVPLLYIVIISVLCICPQIPFITNGPNM